MIKLRKFLFIFASLASLSLVAQNNIHFSQFYNAPMVQNPALTGQFDGMMRATGLYRQQWSGVDDATQDFFTRTMDASVDFSFLEKKLGIGFCILNDQSGNKVFNTYRFMFSLAYGIKMGRSQLSIGVQPIFFMSSLDQSKLVFSSTNPTLSSGSSYFDLSTGVNFHTEKEKTKWDIGFSGSQLMGAKESYDKSGTAIKVPLFVRGYTQFEFDYKPKVKIMPGLQVLYQAQALNILPGTNFGFKIMNKEKLKTTLYAGVWSRINSTSFESVIPIVGLGVNNVKLMFSYDYNLSLSKLNSSLNTFEISLVLITPKVPPIPENNFLFNPRY